MSGPIDPGYVPVRVGPVFDVQEQLTYLRAGIAEPTSDVAAQDKLAQRYVHGLLDQPDIVTDENREAIAKAVLCLAGQVALVGTAPGCHPAVVLNILGLAGLHLYECNVQGCTAEQLAEDRP